MKETKSKTRLSIITVLNCGLMALEGGPYRAGPTKHGLSVKKVGIPDLE